jgi:hypothetical protein
MDEIKNLLNQWKNDGLSNPGALEAACNAIELLVTRIENLENKLANLQFEE